MTKNQPMKSSTLYVVWDDTPPTAWNAALTVIERKHPEYSGRDVTFDKMPTRTQWNWSDEGECSGTVAEAYDRVNYSKKYPALNFTVEAADIIADAKEKSFYEGWLVTLKASDYNVEQRKFIELLHEQYALIENGENDFEFVDLKRVDHPKVEEIKQ